MQLPECFQISSLGKSIKFIRVVNAMHITASVFINDDESGLHQEYARWLEELAPPRADLALPAQPDRGR